MEAAAQPGPFIQFVPIIAMVFIFYFLVIRPQQKQVNEHKKMLKALKKGDRVVTNGGLYGTVVNLKGEDLDLKIAEGVKVVVQRSAISKLANPAVELVSQANGSKD